MSGRGWRVPWNLLITPSLTWHSAQPLCSRIWNSMSKRSWRAVTGKSVGYNLPLVEGKTSSDDYL